MHRLLLPSLVLIAALVADHWIWPLALAESGTSSGLRAWPHWGLTLRILALLVFALAWRLRRGRIAWAVVGLLLVAELPRLGTILPSPGLSALGSELGVWIFAGSLVLPIHLALAAVQGEFWVASRAGAWRFALLGVEVLVVVFLASGLGTEARMALQNLGADAQAVDNAAGTAMAALGSAAAFLEEGSPLETAPTLVFLLAIAAIGVALHLRRTPLEAGLLVALAASGVSFFEWAAETPAGTADIHPADIYFSVACAVLGLALVENAFRLAFHDGLTGLPARRALEERLGQMGRTYALAMLDLDHFKKFNDKHGHEVGDQVLRLVASRLQRVTGGGEAFRYGGEEFTVLFPGRSAGEAKAHMDALRQDIAGRQFTVRSPGRPKTKPEDRALLERLRSNAVTKKLKVTVSIGVAERNESLSTPEQVMKAADEALYQAKKAGRNQVAVAGESRRRRRSGS